MIEINYIATGGYIQYCGLFCETLGSFFPNIPKKLRIITDSDYEVGYICNDVIDVEVIKIIDLIYPCINLNNHPFRPQMNSL